MAESIASTAEIPLQISSKDGVLTLRWPKEETPFQISSVVVSEAEEEALQQELTRLFEV